MLTYYLQIPYLTCISKLGKRINFSDFTEFKYLRINCYVFNYSRKYQHKETFILNYIVDFIYIYIKQQTSVLLSSYFIYILDIINFIDKENNKNISSGKKLFSVGFRH